MNSWKELDDKVLDHLDHLDQQGIEVHLDHLDHLDQQGIEVHLDDLDHLDEQGIEEHQDGMGQHGEKGDHGDPGERGFKGAPGDNGPPGERGFNGPPGELGPVGLPGKPGVRGDIGERGLPGPPGASGQQGLQGIKGEKGERGDDLCLYEFGESCSKPPPGSKCPQETDSTWKLFWRDTERGVTLYTRCPGGVNVSTGTYARMFCTIQVYSNMSSFGEPFLIRPIILPVQLYYVNCSIPHHKTACCVISHVRTC